MNSLRTELNLFKQCFIQQNVDLDMYTNKLQSEYNIQATHIHHLIQVSLIIIIQFIFFVD